MSSPRSWGCFHDQDSSGLPHRVFPTLVGVFLRHHARRLLQARLPHARGGVSQYFGIVYRLHSSSPRSWGCFSWQSPEALRFFVFPTLVGVFLVFSCHKKAINCLPHARGGVSLRSLPRPRDAVSSPRSWGCFRVVFALQLHDCVFPTLVGVFLAYAFGMFALIGLPHARGGVSKKPPKLIRL